MTPRPITAELHAHTVYSSDGHIGFEAMMATLSGRGIDLVAITDHDTIAGALEFRGRYLRPTKTASASVHLVVGEEKTLANGTHFIGLWLREEIRSTTLTEAVKEVRSQGGVAVLPHPCRHRDGVWQAAPDEPGESFSGSICFEIFNPKCNYEENARARSFSGPNLIPVGGSDAHYPSDLGECVNVFPDCGDGDMDKSLRRALSGETPISIWGTAQGPGDRGRKYAPLYYRMKPYLRLPRPLVPLAASLYGRYRNRIARRRPPALELKHEPD